MAITNTTDIAGPVDVVFQQTLLRNAHARAPYFAGSTPGEISQNSGTFTVKWRRIENLTPVTTPLAELTGTLALPTREAVRPTVNDLTATVQKYGNFIYLTEEVDLKNFTSQMDKLIEILGINAGQSLNRLQRDELEDNSTQNYANQVATASDVVATLATDASDIDRIVNLLDESSTLRFTPMTTGSTNINTTPILDAYLGITHTHLKPQVRRLTGFTSVEKYAGQVETFRGEFGITGDVRWVETPEASIGAGGGGATATTLRSTLAGGNDIYKTVIFGKDHHGSVGLGFEHIKEIYDAGDPLPGVQLISHARGSSGVGDPLDEVASLGWKSWHAAKVLTNATTPTTGEWGHTLVSAAPVL